ncbi:TetR family transcriptional regulator [Streptomyces sp. BK022]|uniref:TetR/AcrR family transcriptional regulator n=1 Tax=Streptomyces sp. BK022 TaxID=2512123 RepID=UPI0010EBC2DC|nr:TetR/AcrR family transcriptional regulator [Streptomyces sp. BK022]RZU46050.1 TetR family transcriptional regulator [Streptomyces sp. BK022]
MPLTEAGIYAAALRLIDADGVEALTMRRLATELDANPMSLYYHVPNKEAVMRGVTRMVGAQFRTVAPEGAAWQERIRLLATDLRALAHRHPQLMAYSITQQPDFIQADDPFWTALIAIVEAAGVPRSEVPEIAAMMVAVVMGVLAAELNGSLHRWSTLKPPSANAGEDGDGDGPTDPDAADVAPGGPGQDHMFRLVTDTLITGLEGRLTAERAGRGTGP